MKLFQLSPIFRLALPVALLGLVSLPAWALIEYSDTQRQTIVELIDKLEERHYAKLKYDDTLSSQHLDSYIESLDPSKMFFTADDIAEFEKYRTVMDNQLHEGKLDAGFVIFNRFHQRLEARMENILEDLPGTVEKMDFTVDESYELEVDERAWAKSSAELDDRWRRQFKNQVLSLKLAEKPEDEIASTLEKRFQNQLKRVKQYNNQDVFQIYANALTELYDPHTNYLSPRRSENFNINMSLSLEGIGAVLQLEDEWIAADNDEYAYSAEDEFDDNDEHVRRYHEACEAVAREAEQKRLRAREQITRHQSEVEKLVQEAREFIAAHEPPPQEDNLVVYLLALGAVLAAGYVMFN